MKYENLGFTLIEVLVTVFIITLLSAVGMSFFGSMQANNRDQQRLRDLNSVKQALELFRHDKGYYASSSAIQFTCTSPSFASGNKVYMDQLPKDPQCSASRNYLYQATPPGCSGVDCSGYVICAKKDGNKTFNVPTECQTLSCTSNPCDMGVASP